jgi:hypothetical protein
MTDVNLEGAERVASSLNVLATAPFIGKGLREDLQKAAALLRKIPELLKELCYLKLPFADIEAEFSSEGLDTTIAMNSLCKRADGHRKQISRLEKQTAELKRQLANANTRIGEWQPIENIQNETLAVFSIHRDNGHHTRWVSYLDDIGWLDARDGYHRRLADTQATHFIPLPEGPK